MPAGFNELSYWKTRLKGDTSIYRMVGHRALGKDWNRAIYHRRYDVLAAFFSKFSGSDLSGMKVVDCGAGFGLFWPFWRQHGVGEYSALELSPEGIRWLQKELAACEAKQKKSAIQINVADPINKSIFSDRTIVTFMDVLYHIVDDEDFSHALLNAWNWLKPGGYLIFTDCPCKQDFYSGNHVHFRPLSAYARLIGKKESDFQVFPLFYLSVPLESSATAMRFLRLFWGPAAFLSKRFNLFDKFLSKVVYRLDTFLFKTFPNLHSSSSSLIAVRK